MKSFPISGHHISIWRELHPEPSTSLVRQALLTASSILRYASTPFATI